ncbi:aminoglycoside N(3)-acetyltransferase [Deinococcus psychrotolerans]|uniref:Aminoglycoside N(3)-acetyltransferase n=1 Tax=Deinococcus psychrotolerans TaxID=2489213 RepID=A0A3G8YL84_9DEIO|nr:AAC(3) family N-acetyltransferase [Deinococcus psychrotolerans]AZI41846.1 aminoglycoside N(3)-acetyltransferase [Deinococcus psychrotolerans]
MLNMLRRPQVTPAMLAEGLSALGLDGTQHAIVHASLRAFGQVEGGAPALLGELMRRTATLSAPSFTYATLLRAPTSTIYAHFSRESRVSRDIGRLPQLLVERPDALRSFHPALSFVAVGQEARAVVEAQSLLSPYGPIGALYDLDAVALLLGVDHSSNTTLHYGEYLAGVPLLTRYVPLSGQVVPTAFPNCSADFENIAPHVQGRHVTVGRAQLSAYRVRDLVDGVQAFLARHPEGMLCTYPSCRCQEVRRMIRADGLTPRTQLGRATGTLERAGD